MIKDKNAFNPFMAGCPGSCIGKNLALVQIRSLAAKLLSKYDVAFAPGEDGTRLLMESRHHFSISVAPLDLVFTPIRAE